MDVNPYKRKWKILKYGFQTKDSEQNLACTVVLYGLWSKHGFYIFRVVNTHTHKEYATGIIFGLKYVLSGLLQKKLQTLF